MSRMEEVRNQMMQAMKAGDKPRKECLSLLLSALKAKFIDKRAELTEDEENEVIARELKQTRETLESLPEDRTDLIEECQFRIHVLSEFAPKEMSEDEIRTELQNVLKTLGIQSPTAKDKGAIMKQLMPRVKGKADGAAVSRLVGELFQ